MKKDIIILLIVILLFFFFTTCSIVGLINKNNFKQEPVKKEKQYTYIELAQKEEADFNKRWESNIETYPILINYSEDNNNFIITITISKNDYKNYKNYKANIDVEKTWTKLVSTLQTVSKEGYNKFIDKKINVNYYFYINNPNNTNENILIVKNGDIIKNTMLN